ncbi:MAG: fused MFS/spermidine synthase [Anaerolineales bacterium]|jgi:spermidine synthase
MVLKRYLYFTVFSAGMTTLAVELSASRLLGSVFGTSNVVWASIIGLILIYLTLGYFLGGRWADRAPYERSFYSILAWGAFTAGLVPFAARPVLRLAADAFDQLEIGVLTGSFTAVLVLFIIPITLLGMISPYAIRLAISNRAEAGRVSGRIYAVSTLGSFVGTFLPVLVLIPLLGTTFTFLAFGGYLTFVAIIGKWRVGGWREATPWILMPVGLGLLAFLWANAPIKATAGQIYETESAYNYIQVLEVDGYRYLRLNEGQGIHSIYHPEELDYQGPWMQFLAAPFFNPAPHEIENVNSVAVVGLAAGTIPRQATAVYGPIPIDGFEIDPQIIDVGKEYFNMTMLNLNAIAQDGRWGLEHNPRRYSLIALDAYRPPYIPWHLTTLEFFQIVNQHLEKDGAMAINVGSAPNDRRLIEGLIATIGYIFPSVYVMDVPETFNSVIYATVQPTRMENMLENFVLLSNRDDVHPLLLESIERTIVHMRSNPCEGATPSTDCILFSDDQAPIEWITNNMVLNYILFSGMEELQ